MSGIAGIYNLQGNPIELENALEKMLFALQHRGPDGSEIWHRGSVGLGHCMLWTTPESLQETLPFANQSGDLAITADARIDNRDELIAKLELNPNNTLEISDSQLILSAYEKWGQYSPHYLLGDFAFVIWDKRQQQLFCSRDHFGVKPFYYYSCDEYFIFASEIKAILTMPQVPPDINELRIADWFIPPMVEDKTMTVYQNICRLPPAHCLTVSLQEKITINCYWKLDPKTEIVLPSNEDYAKEFRKIFFESVRCRLRSAYSIGAHLSGGLDSSSITCTARAIFLDDPSQKLHTFSNIFDDVPSCDEREYFNQVLDQGDYIPHYIHADQQGPLTDLETVLQYVDEPCIGPNYFLVHELNRAAQIADVRVVLDGFDGDTVVSHGALYFTELAKQGKWKEFIAESKAISQHFEASPGSILFAYALPYLAQLSKQNKWVKFAKTAFGIYRNFTISPITLLIRYGLRPKVPIFVSKLRRSLLGKGKLDENSNFGLNAKFLERPKVRNLSKGKTQANLPSLPQNVRAHQYEGLTSGLFTHTLELVDQSAASFSIEVRHPFLDKRLVEFCLALPPQQKLNNGWSRVVMRRAMDGILPEAIRWRGGKTDVGGNFDHGLLNTDRSILEDAIFRNTSEVEEFVNLPFLQNSFKNLVSQVGGPQDNMMELWKVSVLALWLRNFSQKIHKSD